METVKSRRERKKEQAREAILLAAIAEFRAQGFKNASVAAIMERADMGLGTFYNYFASKDEILLVILGTLVEKVRRLVREQSDEAKPTAEILTAGCQLIAGFLEENRFILPLFLKAAENASGPKETMPRSISPGFKFPYEDILRRGQLAGEIRDDIPPEIMAEMFHSVFEGAALSRLDISFRDNVAMKVKLLLSGINK